MDFRILPFDESDIPDLDHALQHEYGEKARHNTNVLLACFLWDKNGWFVAKVGERRVGFVASCAMDHSEAVNGYYIVLGEFRGKGIGTALWDTMMNHLGNRNLCITSVESSLQHNLNSGFTYNPFNVLCVQSDPTKTTFDPHTSVLGLSIREYTNGMIDDVIEYDTKVHVIPRVKFLTQWLDIEYTVTYLAVMNDVIVGYGCIQPLANGLMMIAPVLADNHNIADAILYRLYTEATERGKQIVMDIIEQNDHMKRMAEKLNLVVQSREYRLYNRGVPVARVDKTYVLTTDSFSLL